MGASARLVLSHSFLPSLALPILTQLRARVTEAQIFTVIYKMDGPHPLLPVFPGMRIAWAVSPRQRGRVLPACSEPEFPGLGLGLADWTFLSFPQVILP